MRIRGRWRPLRVDCCDPTGKAAVSAADRIARSFDRQIRESAAVDDTLPDPEPISQLLLDLFGDVKEARPSLLDLGSGSGTTAIRLAQRGARRVTGIDLSPASIETARNRMSIAGLDENQIRFEVADAASVPLQAHQWVLLDRVICCYQDADALLANALSATEVRLAFSAPESRGWRGALNAVAWGAENLWKAVARRATCRGYVHDLEAIERLLNDAGFRRLREGRRRRWYAAVFERSTDNQHGGGQSDLGQSRPSST